jgi:4-hydroxyproline epimerase
MDHHNHAIRRIRVIDSHTGGEPTRTVIEGGPDLGTGPITDRLQRFRDHHDHFRSAVVNEPRGSDVMVGALLQPPEDPTHAAAVIFFNNVGYLGMCGHGAIGVIATLAWMGRIAPGDHVLETPVGNISAHLKNDGSVVIGNVPSYRFRKAVAVPVEGFGTVTGDIAWGGNWFFLVESPHVPVAFQNLEQLTEYATSIRRALTQQGVTGADGAEIDHIELFGPSTDGADSRNYVLCPGLAYDRSPCGTGTSAKVACLAADSKLAPGQIWRQESIVGSVFEARYTPLSNGSVAPHIQGRAHVCAESTLLLDPNDPFQHGIRCR